MTDQSTNTLASDEEIMAAIADAEQAAVPTLDDGSESSVVAVPVPAQPDSIPIVSKQSPTTGVAVVSSTTNEQPRDNADDAHEVSPVPTNLISRVAYYIYNAIDTTLAIINHPFKSLSPQRRQLAGYLAIATIILSVVAVYVLPMLIPPRDAISLLTNKSTALSAQPTHE